MVLRGAETRAMPTMSAGMKIERITIRYTDLLSRFFCDNDLPEVRRWFDPFLLNEDTARKITEGQSQNLYYAASDETGMLGFCMLRGWDEGYEVPSLGVLVDHERRGQGVGQKLTQFALDVARERGCPSVRLSVNSDNLRALNLYSSAGFSEASRTTIGNGNETREKIIMTINLNNREVRNEQ